MTEAPALNWFYWQVENAKRVVASWPIEKQIRLRAEVMRGAK